MLLTCFPTLLTEDLRLVFPFFGAAFVDFFTGAAAFLIAASFFLLAGTLVVVGLGASLATTLTSFFGLLSFVLSLMGRAGLPKGNCVKWASVALSDRIEEPKAGQCSRTQ